MRKGVLFLSLVAALAGFADFERAEVEWHFPLPNCHEGIPFGNAVSGFLVYGESNVLKVVVGRDDTWDHRGGYDWHDDQTYVNIVRALQAKDMSKVKDLFRRGEMKPGEPKNPQIIPVGRYEFALPADCILDEGELDTGTGIAEIETSKGKIALAMDRRSGALAIRWPKGVSASCTTLPAWKEKMYSTENENPLVIDPPVRFALEGGEGFAQPLPSDPAIGSGCVTRRGESFIAAVRGADTSAAKAAIAEVLADRAAAGSAATAKSSADYWRAWWKETPEIDVPDPVIREIHDLGMYKFGSMAGADGVPAPLQGPWIEDYRLPPWHGDYHFNINVQLCYWPAFRGNHLEALKPLFAMIRSWWPVMRENARKFAGIDDGFMLPHSVDDRCRLIGGYWAGTMDFACTPWICQMMMRYVRMSGDRAFLASDAYPLMKGTFNVLRALMSDDGKRLSYPVSTSPEFDTHGGWGVDSSFQLAATHRLVRDLIEAAEMLGEKPDPRWLDVKGRLPLAAFKGGWGGEIELWRGLTLPESHRHHSHLAGYVPFDTLDLTKEYVKDSTRKTVSSYARYGLGLWSGWSFGWASMIQTRWGQADAAEMLVKYWERMFTNPGHGSRHDIYFPGLGVMRRGTNGSAWGVTGDAPGEEIMQIDGAMACTAAIQAMMVDESQGTTYVFRGAPARWRDCSFRNVLSDNGTLVSARRRKGKVEYVEFFSKRGGTIRLDSPWLRGARIDVVLKPGETRRITAADPYRWTDAMDAEWAKLKVEVKSTLDGSMQPAYFRMPDGVPAGRKVPLFVVLHSWSYGYTMLDPATWGLNEANRRGWAFLYPHFRGPNRTPQGCGSDLAVQDIVDQVAWAKANYPIDGDRVYILGGSGGGHMALIMAGRHPEIWAGVYAACPPADVAQWYRDCFGCGNGNAEYCNMLKAACGGTPDEKPEEYRHRSATTWLGNARGVPIQICTGIHDGHMYKGTPHSVPPGHSMRSFNILADGKDRIPEDRILEMNRTETVPEEFRFTGKDPFFAPGQVLMRRTSGNACLTIMDGGHGGNYRAGCYWLNRQRRGRPVDWTVPDSADADDREIHAITN